MIKARRSVEFHETWRGAIEKYYTQKPKRRDRMGRFHVKTGHLSKLAQEKSEKAGRPANNGTVGMYAIDMSEESEVSRDANPTQLMIRGRNYSDYFQ